MIDSIDAASYDAKVTQATRPVVVDFYGQNCPPCEKLHPILEDLSAQYGDRATFVKIDIEDASDLAAELGVFSVPTVLFYSGGAPVDKVVGVPPKAKLAAKIDGLLAG